MANSAVKRVLIGGASGRLGLRLAESLTRDGHQVIAISRTPKKLDFASDVITWDDLARDGLPECDVAINLSGANIIETPWTENGKKELISSRVETTTALCRAISASPKPPSLAMLGAAVGIYPSSDTMEYDEDTSLGEPKSFVDELCHQWEASFLDNLKDCPQTRKVVLRTGIVLSLDRGSALEQMYWPFYLGVGGPLGSGQQYFPWIHKDDWVGIVRFAMDTASVEGILNLVADSVNTNGEFSTAVASAMWRPCIFPVPAFVLNYMFGERAQLLLEGQKVVPKRVLLAGYKYRFSKLADATRDLLS